MYKTRIKETREKLHISQSGLAKKAGCASTTVVRWETHGIKELDAMRTKRILANVAKALNVEVSELLIPAVEKPKLVVLDNNDPKELKIEIGDIVEDGDGKIWRVCGSAFFGRLVNDTTNPLVVFGERGRVVTVVGDAPSGLSDLKHKFTKD